MGDSDFVGMNRDNEMQTPLFDVGGTGGRQHVPVTEQSRQVKPSPVPSIVWLVMKITCLFSARYLTVERTCFRCQVDRFRRLYVMPGGSADMSRYFPEVFDPSGQGYDLPDRSPRKRIDFKSAFKTCLMCNSYWWDYNGDICKYSDATLGVGRWNHRGSWLLSIFFLFTILSMNIADLVNFLVKGSSFIFSLSYLIFLTELSLFPFFNVYSKFKTSTQDRVPIASWFTTLNARFITRRLQFIDFREKGLPGKLLLFVCFAWPIELLLHRIMIYAGRTNCTYIYVGVSFDKVLSLFSTYVLMTMWSNFQYLIFVCRISFVRQFKLVRTFVQTHQEDLDACRHVIWSAFYDFNCYRRFVYIYMMILLPISSWGITSALCLQYKGPDPCPSILWMIWSQIAMFLGLSYSAAGGLDVTYLWDHFRHQLLSTPQDRVKSRFWRKIIYHMDHTCIESDSVNWTIMLSFVSGFAAVSSSDVSL